MMTGMRKSFGMKIMILRVQIMRMWIILLIIFLRKTQLKLLKKNYIRVLVTVFIMLLLNSTELKAAERLILMI